MELKELGREWGYKYGTMCVDNQDIFTEDVMSANKKRNLSGIWYPGQCLFQMMHLKLFRNGNSPK